MPMTNNGTTRETAANRTRIRQAETVLAEMLDESLRRGFFGTARLELSIQDGTVQHVRRVIERIEK